LKFNGGKRKAESISGLPEDVFVHQSRKISISPALRNSPSTIQHQVLAAQARLAAAERKKQELKLEYEAALVAQREKDKVRSGQVI
jgi:hypothetical protein